MHAGVWYHKMLAVFRATKATVEIYQMDARCKPNCLGTTGNCLVYGALEKLASNASHTVVFVYAQCTDAILHLLWQIGIGGLKCRYTGDNFAVMLDTKVESRWMGVLRVDYVRNIHAWAHYVTTQNVKLGGIVVVNGHLVSPLLICGRPTVAPYVCRLQLLCCAT